MRAEGCAWQADLSRLEQVASTHQRRPQRKHFPTCVSHVAGALPGYPGLGRVSDLFRSRVDAANVEMAQLVGRSRSNTHLFETGLHATVNAT